MLNYIKNVAHKHPLVFLSTLVICAWVASATLTTRIYALTSIDATTSVTVSNSAPVFTVIPVENPASTLAAPINVGGNIAFTATGTDSNGDNYYLAICKTNLITANNNATPTCDTGQTVCASGQTTSGTQATCNYTALTGDTEVVNWYGFVCDRSSGSICSSASQGSGDSGSPFYVNHNPIFTSVTPTAAADPGQSITFNSVAYDNDVESVQDSVHLIVCSVVGATSSGCTNPANQLCASGNVTNNPSCSYTLAAIMAAGNHNYYAYIYDQHGLGSLTNYRSGTFAVNNLAPSLSNLSLNNSNSINLSVSTTTAVPFSFSISDTNGYTDVNSINAKLYRTGVGSGASDNSNNHYTLTSCTRSNATGATADYACSFNVQYHADPTDVTTTQYYADNWTATATITDGGALSASSSSTPTELNSLLGISLATSINYGSLNQGQNTGATNQSLNISTVGNTGLNVQLKGTDMDDGLGNIIPAGSQKYGLLAFNYTSGGIALTTSDVLNELRVVKTTVTASPAFKPLFWGIEIPIGVPAGNYTGTNTVTGVVSDPLYW